MGTILAKSSWQVSLRRRGQSDARIVELARLEARHPALGEVIDLRLPDGSTIRARIVKAVQLPSVESAAQGAVRFRVTTEEA
jgi:hypothetical protein